jgi:hypothetical protein
MKITLESLQRMHKHHNSEPHWIYKDKCTSCGSDVSVQIIKTSGGYGLQGGVLFENGPLNIIVSCTDCYEKYGEPIQNKRSGTAAHDNQSLI